MPLSSVGQGMGLQALGVGPGAKIKVLRGGHPGDILQLACGFLEFMLRHDQSPVTGRRRRTDRLSRGGVGWTSRSEKPCPEGR